jgi:membrane fusion protein, heavy metal efflux system
MTRALRARGFGLLLLWAVAGSGCTRAAPEGGEHDEHGHEHSEAESEASAAPSDGLLRVERDMLRDLRITTSVVESRPAGDTVTALGELRVNEAAYAEVGSPIAARVAALEVEPGDRVAAGAELAQLESVDVGRARAALIGAQARTEQARRALERRQGLAKDQIIAERELDSARADLAEIDAERRSAEQTLAALGAARGNGARFALTSPIAGTVIERNALRGRLVDADRPLFAIGDLSLLWLVVHAFERDAVRVVPGREAIVTFPALPGQSFGGKVTRVGSRVDPSSRTVDVRIELPNADGVLRPGMSATASIAIGDDTLHVVAVPVAALQRLPQGWCVFLPAGEEGVFELRPVGRGRDLSGEVEILQGLKPGERVVVDGAFLLKAEADKARGGGASHDHH